MATISFNAEALHKVPLAEASLRILHHLLDDEGLNRLYDTHRGPCYQRKLAFSDFTRLIADSLLEHHGASAHRTFQTLRERDSSAASIQAVYKKLARLPPAVSLGLFDYAAARLDELSIRGKPLNATPLSLAGFRLLAFDGKTIKHVARKLKALRRIGGKFCGGKLLVAIDVATERAVGVEANLDGEASDIPLAEPLMQRIRATSVDRKPRLWIGDRLYCSAAVLQSAAADGDAFIIRHRSNFHFHPTPGEKKHTGVDREGRPFIDEIGTLGQEADAIRVRRICIETEAKDTLAIVTMLTDAEQYPAVDLLEAYRLRWSIETIFQQVVQTFRLRHLIGGSPRAILFQAVLALLLSNVTYAVRDIVAAANTRKIKPEQLSLRHLFEGIRRQLGGLFLMVEGPDTVLSLLNAQPLPTPKSMRAYLDELLRSLPIDRYRKAPTRTGVPKPKDRGYICGGHTSVYKALNGQIKIVPLANNKTKPSRTKKEDAKDV